MDTIWEGIKIEIRIWPILKPGYGFRVEPPTLEKGRLLPIVQ